VTFAVAQVIKGKVGSELTMKQFGTATPLSHGSMTHLPGLPSYAPRRRNGHFPQRRERGRLLQPDRLGAGEVSARAALLAGFVEPSPIVVNRARRRAGFRNIPLHEHATTVGLR
jgi:hypothetical protein